MIETGILRRIDELGRIVIPIEIRESLDINTKDRLEISVEGDKVILKKYEPCCVFCGSREKTVIFKDKLVCEKCKNELHSTIRNN